MKPARSKPDPKRKKKLSKEQTKQPPETDRAEGQDGRADYGGLPDRDLKKNLGCG